MGMTLSERVETRPSALGKAGLPPGQIWVPDTRRPGFPAECRRQSQLAAQADLADQDLLDFMDAALADTDDWTS